MVVSIQRKGSPKGSTSKVIQWCQVVAQVQRSLKERITTVVELLGCIRFVSQLGCTRMSGVHSNL